MTEEAPKITSAIKTPREKNPGRVAAGKRLDAISKEAKEKKRLERENAIKQPRDNNENSETTIILVGGLVVAGVVLYFLKFHNTDALLEAPRDNLRDALRDNTDNTDALRDNTTEEPPQKEEPKKFQAHSMDDLINK